MYMPPSERNALRYFSIDLHFRHAVHNRLGLLANDLVSSQFMNVNGSWVYRVEVKPSPELVSLEQQVYVRQGTSKWLVPADQVAALRRQRAQRLAHPDSINVL